MEGLEKAARVRVQVAAQSLSQELSRFKFDSEEFKALGDALRTLQKVFGKSKDEDRKLFPAETMNLVSSIKEQSPGQKAMSATSAPPGASA